MQDRFVVFYSTLSLNPQIVARTYPIMYCGLEVYMHAFVYSHGLSREMYFLSVECSELDGKYALYGVWCMTM